MEEKIVKRQRPGRVRRHRPVSLANIYPQKYSNRVPKSLVLNYLSHYKITQLLSSPAAGQNKPSPRHSANVIEDPCYSKVVVKFMPRGAKNSEEIQSKAEVTFYGAL
jgi:hypothetical protein